jgi:uncharacterized membrane protein
MEHNLIDYIRVIIFPLCSLGFTVSAVYEYQARRSKLRLAIMLSTALAMLVWMSLTIEAMVNPTLMEITRDVAVTPIIFILTVLIWVYALLRVHVQCKRRYNIKQWKGGCENGKESDVQ